MKRTIEEIEVVIYEHIKECPTCGGEMDYDMQMYPHDGGIEVDGYEGKQWVYFECKDCGYCWALWKLLNRIDRMKEVDRE